MRNTFPYWIDLDPFHTNDLLKTIRFNSILKNKIVEITEKPYSCSCQWARSPVKTKTFSFLEHIAQYLQLLECWQSSGSANCGTLAQAKSLWTRHLFPSGRRAFGSRYFWSATSNGSYATSRLVVRRSRRGHFRWRKWITNANMRFLHLHSYFQYNVMTNNKVRFQNL